MLIVTLDILASCHRLLRVMVYKGIELLLANMLSLILNILAVTNPDQRHIIYLIVLNMMLLFPKEAHLSLCLLCLIIHNEAFLLIVFTLPPNVLRVRCSHDR